MKVKGWRKTVFLVFVFSVFCLNGALECGGAGAKNSGRSYFTIDLTIKKIAVFPFSDHTVEIDESVEVRTKERKAVAGVIDCFEEHGVSLVLQNLVEETLMAENVIIPFEIAGNPFTYSFDIVDSVKYGNSRTLRRKVVMELAEMLGADAVVRGVILDQTPNNFMKKDKILKKGQYGYSERILIPFFMRGKMSYAIARNYESGLPFFLKNKPVSFLPVGRNRRTIRVIIFIQSGKSGEVVWSNSFEMNYYDRGGHFSADFEDKLRDNISLAMRGFFSSLSFYEDSWLFIVGKNGKPD